MISIFSAFGDEVLSYKEVIPESVFNKNIMLTVAEDSGTMVGIIAATASKNNDLHILYIMVADGYKGRGIGRSMVAYTRQVVAAMGLSRILVFYIKDNSTVELNSFFSAVGFTETQSGAIYSIDISSAAEIADDYREEVADYRVLPLSTVTGGRYNKIREILKELRDGNDSKKNDIYMDPGPKSRYRGDISFIAYDKNDNPKGVILFRDTDMGVVLDYLCVFKKNNGFCMFALFAAVGSHVLDNWPVKETNKPMYFHGYNKVVYGIAKSLGIKCQKAGESVCMEMIV